MVVKSIKEIFTFEGAEIVGRAKGLMESSDLGYRGYRSREGFMLDPCIIPARRNSCSRENSPLLQG